MVVVTRTVLLALALMHLGFAVFEIYGVANPEIAGISNPWMVNAVTGSSAKRYSFSVSPTGDVSSGESTSVSDETFTVIVRRKGDETYLFNDRSQELINDIVRNCGVFNLVLVAGFLWAAFPHALGRSRRKPTMTMLGYFFSSAAVAAGLAGWLITPATLFQAGLGLLGVICCALTPGPGEEPPATP